MRFRRQRWSDKDKYFGPFTIAPNESSWSVILDSGDDDYSGCHLRVMAPGFAILVALPQIIRPWRQGYECAPRQYGFSIFEGHFSLRYGRQTHDSSTEQSWGCFLPWTQWRFVRQSWYGLNGEHVGTVSPPDFSRQCEIRDSVPRASFRFLDFDGEEIEASTFITEREWRFGAGGFRWLSLFRKPHVRRSLEMRFSKEVGPRKGSWKGGIIGHGIDMLPGELHEDAFRRYCIEHGLTFVERD